MNLACVGARPLGLVNCLNFGNPEHPEVMWQLSEAIDGMAEACRAFGIPVVGGNVSLYNESRGRDIDPTPVVGLVGLVDRLDRPPPGVRLVDGGTLLAARAGRPVARRLAVGVGAGRATAVRRRRSTSTRTRARRRPGPRRWSPTVGWPGVHDTADGLGRGAGRDGRAERDGVRRRRRRAPTTAGCSPSRRAGWSRASPTDQADAVVRAAQAAGVAVERLGRGRRRPPRRRRGCSTCR